MIQFEGDDIYIDGRIVARVVDIGGDRPLRIVGANGRNWHETTSRRMVKLFVATHVPEMTNGTSKVTFSKASHP